MTSETEGDLAHTHRRPCEDRGRDWTNATRSKECQQYQQLKEVRMDPPLEPSEGMQI